MLPVPMKGSYINLPGAAYIHRVGIVQNSEVFTFIPKPGLP